MRTRQCALLWQLQSCQASATRACIESVGLVNYYLARLTVSPQGSDLPKHILLIHNLGPPSRSASCGPPRHSHVQDGRNIQWSPPPLVRQSGHVHFLSESLSRTRRSNA
ncbi:hypothetical protein SCHPADRAFT_626689 [Schizopora paradoxa]|uniref:Uncharacterized protein n=1 Tax=Schizopora paradoxa TaxID=27342 RepID=A0A0H2R800_9AGAM|nr:hypothetical protein SCHPADRAFT_626689 [Schizopora paradoxa]